MDDFLRAECHSSLSIEDLARAGADEARRSSGAVSMDHGDIHRRGPTIWSSRWSPMRTRLAKLFQQAMFAHGIPVAAFEVSDTAVVEKDGGVVDLALPGEAVQRRHAEPAGKVRVHPALEEQLCQRPRLRRERHPVDHSRVMAKGQTHDRFVSALGGFGERAGIVARRESPPARAAIPDAADVAAMPGVCAR